MSLNTIIFSVVYASSYSMILPFAAGLWKYRQQTKPMRFFFLFMTTNLCFEIGLHILSYMYQFNLWLLNILYLVQPLFVLQFYRMVNTGKTFRKVSLYTMLAFILVWSGFMLHYGIKYTEGNSMAISNLLVLFASGYMLIYKIQQGELNLFRNQVFIIALSYFLFSSVAVILFSILQKIALVNRAYEYSQLFIFSMVNVTSNLLFAYSFLCSSTKQKSY